MTLNKTTISIFESTALKLKRNQDSLSETYDDIINKLIDYYEIHKKQELNSK